MIRRAPLVEITSDPATAQHSVYITRIWENEDGTLGTDKQFVRSYLTRQTARDGADFLWSCICDARAVAMAEGHEH